MTRDPIPSPVCVHRSADGLAAGPWDEIIGPTPTAQYGCLRTFEAASTIGVVPHYFVLGAAERPLAVAIGHLANDDWQRDRVTRPLLGRARALKPALLRLLGPTLILGLRPMYGPSLFARIEPNPDASDEYLQRLCAGIEQYADERGWAIAVVGLTDRDRNVCEALRRRGFLETLGAPTAELDIQWDSWDGYLDGLNYSRRNVVRREIKVFEKAGCRIRRLHPDEPVPPRAYPLIQEHQLRNNNRGAPYSPDLVPALQRNLGKNAWLYLAEQDGELLGFLAVVVKDSAASATFLGIGSQVKARKLFVYFNLVFYNLIREAMILGLSRIQYGSQVYEGKRLRGCSIVPTRLFLRPRNRFSRAFLCPMLALHRRWYRTKLRPAFSTELVD